MSTAASDNTHAPSAVVGIGASAGGLAALKAFFEWVPEESGLAFVIVVHLSPEHESHLDTVLQPHTRLPVLQVTETVPLQSDRIYVIPPGANIEAVDTHLRQKTTRLQEEAFQKEMFIATLGHELRNPLSVLDSTMRVVESGAAELAEVQPTLGRHIRSLVTLVDDLLDVSRISHGKAKIKKRSMDLVPLVHGVAETLRQEMQGKRQELVLTLPEKLEVMGDPLRLEQALSNLMGNAAKYTPELGRIEVRAWREASLAVIEVSDTGRGIERAQLDTIFEPFVQERPGDEGLGIGLPISQALVNLHGGTLVVASAGRDKGSTFTIRLPIGSQESSARRSQQAEPAAPRDHDLEGLRVLVVDDLRDAADMLAVLLRTVAVDTLCAYTGAEALQKAKEWSPHAALVDLGLPDMPGYEVAARLRSEEAHRDMLLLAVTGFSHVEAAEEATRAGFDGRLVKPLDHQELNRLLAKHWARLGRQHLDAGS